MPAQHQVSRDLGFCINRSSDLFVLKQDHRSRELPVILHIPVGCGRFRFVLKASIITSNRMQACLSRVSKKTTQHEKMLGYAIVLCSVWFMLFRFFSFHIVNAYAANANLLGNSTHCRVTVSFVRKHETWSFFLQVKKHAGLTPGFSRFGFFAICAIGELQSSRDRKQVRYN